MLLNTILRLEILKNSLIKKEKQFDDKLQNHINTVKQANGQPLNYKRNGRATLNKWDRQNESLRNLKDSIQKTKDEIEKEEAERKLKEKLGVAGGNPLRAFIARNWGWVAGMALLVIVLRPEMAGAALNFLF